MITFEVAKQYLDQRFSIFPVILKWDPEKQKYDKRPAVNWGEFQTRRATDEELHEWFDTPKYNAIGLVTGQISGVVVVDVEHDATEDDLSMLQSDMVARTISGGWHFYYRWTQEIRNTVRIEGRKIDFRGDGGYVVIPPSQCGEAEYTWERQMERMYLRELPKEIVTLLQASRVAAPEAGGYALSNLNEWIGVGEGGRNDSLYKMAVSLLQRMHPGDALVNIQAINRGYLPPLPEHEVMQLFNSAIKFLQGESRLYAPPTPTEAPKMELDFKYISDWNIQQEELSWLWEGFLAKKHMTLFSALWKVGKTTLIGHLMAQMSKHGELAGQAVKPSRVLILSEESEFVWAQRRDEFGITTPVFALFRPIRHRLSLNEWGVFIGEIAAFCAKEQIDAVIVDTLSGFWPVDNENDNAKVQGAILPLMGLLEDSGVAVMLIHHFRKSGGEQATASRGAGALMGAVDIIMEFSRLPTDPNSNKRVLKGYARFQDTPQEIVIELGDNGYEMVGSVREVAKKEAHYKMLSLLPNEDPGYSVQDIRELWPDDPVPSKRTIRRYLQDLRNEGSVIFGARTVKGDNPRAETYLRYDKNSVIATAQTLWEEQNSND